MHLFFIDESGTAPPPDKSNTKYFILGGVAIPENYWHDIAAELRQIKRKYGINHEIKWRYFAPNNQDNENSIRNLSVDEKEQLRIDLFNSITKYKSVKIISVVADVNKAYSLSYINNQEELYAYSYKILTERFQYYLQDMTRTVGEKINGIVVCDHRGPKDDKKLRQLHEKLLNTDRDTYSAYQNLIEGLFIAPSDLSIGIQYADMIAGAIYRKFSKEDLRYYNLIKNSIRSHEKTGQIEGYGIARLPKI